MILNSWQVSILVDRYPEQVTISPSGPFKVRSKSPIYLYFWSSLPIKVFIEWLDNFDYPGSNVYLSFTWSQGTMKVEKLYCSVLKSLWMWDSSDF